MAGSWVLAYKRWMSTSGSRSRQCGAASIVGRQLEHVPETARMSLGRDSANSRRLTTLPSAMVTGTWGDLGPLVVLDVQILDRVLSSGVRALGCRMSTVVVATATMATSHHASEARSTAHCRGERPSRATHTHTAERPSSQRFRITVQPETCSVPTTPKHAQSVGSDSARPGR